MCWSDYGMSKPAGHLQSPVHPMLFFLTHIAATRMHSFVTILLCDTAQMRRIVQTMAQLFPAAIVSGRGREKVQNFVQLRELFYAGSHGMDIVGPQVHCQIE